MRRGKDATMMNACSFLRLFALESSTQCNQEDGKMQAVKRESLLYSVPLDSNSVPQPRLNIDDKIRSNLFPWSGQFSPQLVHALLETFGRPGCLVADPFMGSGTVLVESARVGLSAIGSE